MCKLIFEPWPNRHSKGLSKEIKGCKRDEGFTHSIKEFAPRAPSLITYNNIILNVKIMNEHLNISDN